MKEARADLKEIRGDLLKILKRLPSAVISS